MAPSPVLRDSPSLAGHSLPTPGRVRRKETPGNDSGESRGTPPHQPPTPGDKGAGRTLAGL